jgi:tRNA (uracil-5-)-methyltransferase
MLQRLFSSVSVQKQALTHYFNPLKTTAKLFDMSEQNPRKREFQGKAHGSIPKKFKKFNKKSKSDDWPLCDKEDVLLREVQELLQDLKLPKDAPTTPLELQVETEFEITKMSSTGPGLALHKPSRSVLIIPFSVPGDVVTAKPFKYFDNHSYYLTDFVKVHTPSASRDDSRIRCQYFSRCAGCQYQMLAYQDQLSHKKTIVQNAYRWFSNLKENQIPDVRDTMGSPLQYGYRTKLTPHFDRPPGAKQANKKGEAPAWVEMPPIGFMLQGTRKTIDIEDCPIGTEAVQRGMTRERKRCTENIKTFKKGVTLLLRETTERTSKDEETKLEIAKADDQVIVEERDRYIHLKRCITDPKGTSEEYIDDYVFSNPASAFFQNNNSILSPFIQYIRDQVQQPSDGTSKISYLVDAYCGSGLFTITLSSIFKKSIGIDIAPSSIEYASKNATRNNLPDSQASFLAADAAEIFAKIEFPPSETLVVIDPPRKGCDKPFLTQLLKFGPQRLVYVSCNVNTQARDVGCLVNGIEGVDGGFGDGKGAYKLESLRGFDFFPQTGHVEGVAVLEKLLPTEANQKSEIDAEEV